MSAETPLAALLRDRIRAAGPIPFAEYMRACLYHPEFGYYSRAPESPAEDYYTSVSLHPVFGRLLARQLEEMWRHLGRPDPFHAVEAGAGSGALAAQILDFARRAVPEFYAALRYTAVECSAARRALHAARLTGHAAGAKFTSCGTLPERIAAGCVFSNELFDAMPVDRVLFRGGVLWELRVALDGDRFVEQPVPASAALQAYFAEQGIALREEQIAEVNFEAIEWMETAGRALERGFVLTVDYGHEAAELYDERHMRGTLLAYRQHRADEDWFAAPGRQDLTAHVNFTALERAGSRTGLARTGLASQTAFVLALGRGNDFADAYDEGQSEVARVKARLQLKTLIFPEGMGERFRVMVQHKGVPRPALTGLQPL